MNVIKGKLDFLGMIKGKEDNLYLGLKDRYDRLTVRGPQEEQKNREPSLNVPYVAKLLLPHDPLFTVRFLKNFKTGDGSGFKELVHDIDLSNESVKNILKKVESNPNFIFRYKGERVKDISFLNRDLQLAIVSLIDRFKHEGVPYFRQTGRHPYNNDETYTNFARWFKRNYRYGSGEEYSRFLADLTEMFINHGIPENSLVIQPDARKFNIRATFFTWKPALLAGIKHLIEGIRDHRNIDGNSVPDFGNKNIFIEVEKKTDNGIHYVELRILDRFSRATVDRYTLWEYLTHSRAYEENFRNLCDWCVECDFADDEPPGRLNLLISKSIFKDPNEIQTLDQPVGGYKNILRFYEIR